MRYIVSLLCFLLSGALHAEINADTPPFSLTLEQLAQWQTDSTLADANNIAKVPLQARIEGSAGQLNPALDPDVKVLIAPDGMNNLGNYIDEQNQFNLYNFTHWPQVDVLNWFAGTATQTVNIPARPWVETAHRHGVKVIGSIFLGIAQWGGNIETVEKLVARDADGRFPMAHKLIEIAEYYQFDGWLMNQETDLTAVKDQDNKLVAAKRQPKRAQKVAADVLAFMQYLKSIAPPTMEIHWYDAMIADGRVAWQNELNDNNAMFLQDGTQRSADAMFVNYWWNGEMVQASHQRAQKLGRSPYDVYFGADLWPTRTAQKAFQNRDWLQQLFTNNGNQGLSSIALFANNINYSFSGDDDTPAYSNFKDDARDVDSFYATETRLFAGDDLNMATDDGDNAWVGLARYVPAKSTVTALPFVTNFNTGHGKVRADNGVLKAEPWHNMAEQDLLPSWQFAVIGNDSVDARFDFDAVYHGGSSLRVAGNLTQGSARIPLYRTQLKLGDTARLQLVYQAPNATELLSAWLEIDGQIVDFSLPSQSSVWQTRSMDLKGYEGKTVTRIGLALDRSDERDFVANVGEISLKAFPVNVN